MKLQVVHFQRCGRAPVCQLLCCTTVLFKVLCCKSLNGFLCLFSMYYLCEKYYKPITVQYYTHIIVQQSTRIFPSCKLTLSTLPHLPSPGHHYFCVCLLVAQSCAPLCDPMNGSPPGSSAHGILQARILEWVAMPSSRGSS